MNITGIQVDNFGAWQGLNFGDLPDGLTVIYGNNEAGKSTLMQFVRCVLFGFSPDARRYILGSEALRTGRIGGALKVRGYEGPFQIRRYANDADPTGSPGDVRVTSSDGSRVGAHRLSSLLSGVDEPIFKQVFSVGMSEIQQLGALNETRAAEQLYSLSTGTDRVSLVDVMNQLRCAREDLVGADGKPGLLYRLMRERDVRREEIKRLSRLTEKWSALRSEANRLNQELSRLEAGREQLKRTARRAEVAVKVRPKWESFRHLEAELMTLGAIPKIETSILDKLQMIDEQIAQRQVEIETVQQKRATLESQQAKLTVREGLVREAVRIKALVEQRPWFESLTEEFQRLATHVEEIEFELQAEQEKLGITTAATGVVPRLDPAALAKLRTPAANLNRINKKLKSAKTAAARYREDADRITRELNERLGPDVQWLAAFRDSPESKSKVAEAISDVGTVMKQTGNIADSLRRRLHLDASLDELRSELKSFDTRRDRMLARQFLPKPVIIALATLFALGAILLLTALFGATDWLPADIRGFLGISGAGIGGLAIIWKMMLDNGFRDEIDRCDAHCRTLRRQIADFEDELTQLKATLPNDDREQTHLRDTQSRLHQLEQLAPLDTKRQHVQQRAVDADKQVDRVSLGLKEIQATWERALSHLGLSPHLTPHQLEQLTGPGGQMSVLRRKHEKAQAAWERSRDEMELAQGRILKLMEDAEVATSSQQLLEQLDELLVMLRDQEDCARQRSELRRQIRRYQREEDRVRSAISRLEQKRSSAITSAGAADETDLLNMVERRQKAEDLAEKRNSLNADIQLTLGEDLDQTTITSELLRHSPAELAELVERHENDLKRMDADLKQLAHRRGELSQQINAQNEDRQLPAAHIRLEIAQKKLDDGLNRWKELSATSHLLRRVYRRYEKDRQPETLAHASEFFANMTEGRYTRVWTPLAENTLLCDDSVGNSLPVEHLSRGAREQVYLALRLALVRGYSRRGVRMPLILDDVLVNFDGDRTREAAKVVAEFARSGHQVFVFTCHEHIVQVFEELDVEVRELPRREIAPQHVIPPVNGPPDHTNDTETEPITAGYGNDAARSSDNAVAEIVQDWELTDSTAAEQGINQSDSTPVPVFTASSVVDDLVASVMGNEPLAVSLPAVSDVMTDGPRDPALVATEMTDAVPIESFPRADVPIRPAARPGPAEEPESTIDIDAILAKVPESIFPPRDTITTATTVDESSLGDELPTDVTTPSVEEIDVLPPTEAQLTTSLTRVDPLDGTGDMERDAIRSEHAAVPIIESPPRSRDTAIADVSKQHDDADESIDALHTSAVETDHYQDIDTEDEIEVAIVDEDGAELEDIEPIEDEDHAQHDELDDAADDELKDEDQDDDGEEYDVDELADEEADEDEYENVYEDEDGNIIDAADIEDEDLEYELADDEYEDEEEDQDEGGTAEVAAEDEEEYEEDGELLDEEDDGVEYEWVEIDDDEADAA